MTQYIKTTNESKMIALQEIANAHLHGISKTVVATEKHLTDDEWFFDYDLFIKSIGTNYKSERMQQIGEFVGDNEDVNFVNMQML